MAKQKEKITPPSRDRAYLEAQIAGGHTVRVNDVRYNKANLGDLPSQAELDKLDTATTSATALVEPPSPSQNPGPQSVRGAANPNTPPNQTGLAGQQQTTTEPEFGGKKLSEFKGMTDAQIIALPNIDRATLKKIRDAEAAAAK